MGLVYWEDPEESGGETFLIIDDLESFEEYLSKFIFLFLFLECPSIRIFCFSHNETLAFLRGKGVYNIKVPFSSHISGI